MLPGRGAGRDAQVPGQCWGAQPCVRHGRGSLAAVAYPPCATPGGPKWRMKPQEECAGAQLWQARLLATAGSPAPSIPTRCRGPALVRAPSEGQIKTGVKRKQVATGPCHAATAPAHGKRSLGSLWCPGDSIALAGHLLPAQSKTETQGAPA